MRAKFGWLMIGLLIVAGAAALIMKRSALAALRNEVGRERAALRALNGVRAEHERLLAAQPETGELDRAATDRDALQTARAELEALSVKIAVAARAAAEGGKKVLTADRLAVGRTVPASEWKNVGNATPAAALETALWAGAGGDVEAFAKMITLIDSRTQRAAQALLDSLPEAMRAEYGTPERLIAFLTVKDVPLGAVQVRQFNDPQVWP